MTKKASILKPFDSEQRFFIDQGGLLTQQLKDQVAHALGVKSKIVEPKRHHYITSPPGPGKTFTVQTTADQHNVDMLVLQGIASMNAVVTNLAVLAYTQQTGNLVVWVDDCDSIFMEPDQLNVMKGALDEDRNVLAWNKNMTNQINVYANSGSPSDKIRAEALKAFQPMGSVGVEVPTDRMRFIITSNKALTPPNSKLNTVRKMNEAAIRDRVIYTEFDLDPKKSWGWVAYVLLNNNVLGLDDAQKQVLLDFMWTNWTRLAATSMRAVKDLAADMLNHPANYPDYWQTKLMRQAT